MPGQAALSAGSFGSAAAHRATYAATSFASCPFTRFAGIPLPVVGYRIWSRTTFSIVLSLKCSAFDSANASSRLGPTVPREPASLSVWQLPQRASATKSFLPRFASPPCTAPPVPQPETTTTSATRNAPKRVRNLALCRGAGLRQSLVASGIDREDTVEPGDLEDLRDVPVAADEREPAVLVTEPLDAADEDAEGRRIDERRVREVDDDLFPAFSDHIEELRLELGRGVEIDFPGEGDDVRRIVDFVRLDVEVHG